MPLRILIVEDYADAREALVLLLGLWGYHVRAAATASAALAALDGFTPDVAIVDLTLPDLDGANLAAVLATGLDRRPLMVALSGDARLLTGTAETASFDHLLLKPAAPDLLRQILEEYAAARRRHG